MSTPLRKEKDKIILKLSRDLYKNQFVMKAVDEFPHLVRKFDSKVEEYYEVTFKRRDFKEALSWVNYLFYLHR